MITRSDGIALRKKIKTEKFCKGEWPFAPTINNVLIFTCTAIAAWGKIRLENPHEKRVAISPLARRGADSFAGAFAIALNCLDITIE
ncbi:hypothetical protein STA3757_29630 [Stanieria sp. NIES-3757]|nr:hypothetical protein STA3757_29630 [Stanieria sp. NIES-3757]